MKLIGITGGVGAGKSTLSRFLAGLGYAIIDVDKISHGIDARSEILAHFGLEALKDGKVDRPYLRQLLITDPVAKKTLEDIMRPKVDEEIEKQIIAHSANGLKMAFFDCPLLFEVGADKIVNSIICVTASLERRVQRIMLRDKVTEESAKALISLQIPDEEKARRSTFVIYNELSEQEMLMQAITVLREIHVGMVGL